jgi:AcrR family transcriptional regulator
MDRRIQRTQQLLQQAMLSLLQEKPFEMLEIQEITERANVARVTFYRHYGSREELLMACIDAVHEQMTPLIDQMLSGVADLTQDPPLLPLYRYAEANTRLLLALFNGTASALLQQRMRQHIVNQVFRGIHQLGAEVGLSIPPMIAAQHIASSTIGNLMWWLNAGKPYPVEEFARIVHRLNTLGVASFAQLPAGPNAGVAAGNPQTPATPPLS